jgi:hypothetical protein
VTRAPADPATEPSEAIPVGDDGATIACPVCQRRFEPEGRKRFCGTPCRQAAWRRQRLAPVEPVVAKPDVVYECPSCEARYLGVQRCELCNVWCRRLGPGGQCPHCDEPVSLSDLFSPAQLSGHRIATKPRRR